MAFNKSKALESALKSLNQGRVPDAIREYQQILRQDAKDQVTLMTLGDLFVRQGDMHSATQYFERLAQVYLADGFRQTTRRRRHPRNPGVRSGSPDRL